MASLTGAEVVGMLGVVDLGGVGLL